jgi:hypothetical protein
VSDTTTRARQRRRTPSADMPRKSGDGFEKVRKAAAGLPDVVEGASWGVPSLKVRGTMFACLPTHTSAEPNSLVVRLQFVDRDWLIQSKPDLYYIKPHYVNYACVLVRLRKVRQKDLRELLDVSREFVAGKRRGTAASR